ncbi:hypothetical protein R3P38DRAFT_3231816 [Favolaschia claudopus]|uniref:Uncharacterized protein n=1 Tax=Favolaschia claudopus TaxID=2862362 RepID=A0AAV9ZJH5_9AGAR
MLRMYASTRLLYTLLAGARPHARLNAKTTGSTSLSTYVDPAVIRATRLGGQNSRKGGKGASAQQLEYTMSPTNNIPLDFSLDPANLPTLEQHPPPSQPLLYSFPPCPPSPEEEFPPSWNNTPPARAALRSGRTQNTRLGSDPAEIIHVRVVVSLLPHQPPPRCPDEQPAATTSESVEEPEDLVSAFEGIDERDQDDSPPITASSAQPDPQSVKEALESLGPEERETITFLIHSRVLKDIFHVFHMI